MLDGTRERGYSGVERRKVEEIQSCGRTKNKPQKQQATQITGTLTRNTLGIGQPILQEPEEREDRGKPG